MVSKKHSSPAFTIVELLVVIVVIGILAAITIVSYTGITSRATASALQSDLTNASSQLKLYQIDHSAYPTSLNASNCPLDSSGVVDSTYCIKPTSGNTFLYSSNNNSNPQTFLLYSVNSSANTKYYTTNDSTPALSPQVVATGGAIANVSGYRIHTFTTSGNFTVTSGGGVEFLVVAGGGGGSGNIYDDGAGGGGGGVVYNTKQVEAGIFSVIIGDGGLAGVGSQGSDGGNSSLLGYIAIGGGGGSGHRSSGRPGGSGGGSGGKYAISDINIGGIGTYNPIRQGYDGGSKTNYPGGAGGGGAGGPGMGGDGTDRAGGIGLASSISGTSIYYAGGGGGFPNGVGGFGGGGNTATAGVDGLGGGGGGGKAGTQKDGGSGIVIIRYPF